MRYLILSILLFSLSGCAYYFGNSWQNSYRKIPPTEFPTYSEHSQRISDEALKNHPLVLHFAEQDLIDPSQKAKTSSPRTLLAKLVAGRDIKEVNEFLLNSVPWGNSGTSGFLNPNGDYDFTTILLSAILFRFEKDTATLWPKTADYIADNLLIEEGGRPHTKTPHTMHIMKDTENHILMTNISQYLKNQWLHEHGNDAPEFDNRQNGMEQFLLDNLEELQLTGPYEFNAKPYEGYTISALLVLYSYAHSQELKAKAAETLDEWVWEYLQTSSDFRKSSPFRRRMERAEKTSLVDNASSSMIKTWFLEKEKGAFDVDAIPENLHQAFSALVFDYRPPSEIWKKDDSERLLLIGHGKGSSPEIHSRGNGFLLSAGGFQRGEASQIVARPIVLMLDDGATDIDSCFYIKGKGKWQHWNNTGVYHRFAVGRSTVHVPPQYQAVDSIGDWKLFRPSEKLTVVTYSEEDFGLIYLPTESVDLRQLEAQTPQLSEGVFKSSRTEILFDTKAPKGKWVITEVNGKSVDRKADGWKRVSPDPNV
ncbi:MAG: hypothetical protein GC178_15315 [Flavobacteriales bacterium]|nr:hypothetical protein [Flavobacteriales bacterium]